MKLDELFNTIPLNPTVSMAVQKYHKNQIEAPHRHYEHTDELNERLKKLGWNKGGNGHYSMTYINRDPNVPYIIKVNKKYDRAYAQFALLTKKFPNIHFPIIGKMQLFSVSESDKPNGIVRKIKYYIYLMEKLLPLDDVDVADELNTIATDYYEYPLEDIEKYGFDDLPNSLIRAAQIIGQNAGINQIDIYGNNVMKRRDGTIVIIDPYSD